MTSKLIGCDSVQSVSPDSQSTPTTLCREQGAVWDTACVSLQSRTLFNYTDFELVWWYVIDSAWSLICSIEKPFCLSRMRCDEIWSVIEWRESSESDPFDEMDLNMRADWLYTRTLRGIVLMKEHRHTHRQRHRLRHRHRQTHTHRMTGLIYWN